MVKMGATTRGYNPYRKQQYLPYVQQVAMGATFSVVDRDRVLLLVGGNWVELIMEPVAVMVYVLEKRTGTFFSRNSFAILSL
mmetsp:Transcript_19150/g.44658  ORF Transcript_19150/g.44658 Transcript_19150/m.44658 type:complete len:82 (+) Transcript_19150:1209-1454(+)